LNTLLSVAVAPVGIHVVVAVVLEGIDRLFLENRMEEDNHWNRRCQSALDHPSP